MFYTDLNTDARIAVAKPFGAVRHTKDDSLTGGDLREERGRGVQIRVIREESVSSLFPDPRSERTTVRVHAECIQ